MPDSAEGSSSRGGGFSAGRDSSPVLYPPPYDSSTYLRDYRAYFGNYRITRLPSVGVALIVRIGTAVLDTTAGTWRNQWKYWAVTVPCI